MVYLLILVVAACLLLLLVMLREAFLNRVIHQTITLPDFPSGFNNMRIFFISDIHRRRIDDSIISEAENKVRLVIIGGDLLEKGVPLSRVECNLNLLSKLGHLYFVWGNNDYEVCEAELLQLFKKYNVRMLRNQTIIFTSENGDKLALMGVDDLSQENDCLDRVLDTAKAANFKILISHNPKITLKITEDDHISLVLSGHTHGGQIRIFGFSPYKKGGIYKTELATLFISNGYGTSMLPLRLGAKPETHILTLNKK